MIREIPRKHYLPLDREWIRVGVFSTLLIEHNPSAQGIPVSAAHPQNAGESLFFKEKCDKINMFCRIAFFLPAQIDSMDIFNALLGFDTHLGGPRDLSRPTCLFRYQFRPVAVWKG